MNRLLVALLAAFDAVIVVAVGLAAALAPLTLLWVFAFDGGADWGGLWPAAARVWQAGHFVPLDVHLDAETVAALGIPADGATFTLSLAPAAFALFTGVFAARSGARAARAGAWVIGVAAGTAAVASLAALIALTSPLPVVSADVGSAVLLPAAVFAVPSLGGALVQAWREGDDGILDRLRDRVDVDGTGIVEGAARGIAGALVAWVGLGAAVAALGFALRGSHIVSLFEAAHLDLVGVIVVGLGQLAYLPTLVVWGAAYASGPGFALGAGTAVSPGGTSLGVLPGVPVLGIIPESPSAWLLLLALAVVAIGALAGWIARGRMQEETGEDEPLVPRLIVLGVLVAGAAGGAALLSALAAGSIGPERLQQAGPAAGAVAVAVAIEMGIGAAAVLLAPLAKSGATHEDWPARWDARGAGADAADRSGATAVGDGGRSPAADWAHTVDWGQTADRAHTADLAPTTDRGQTADVAHTADRTQTTDRAQAADLAHTVDLTQTADLTETADLAAFFGGPASEPSRGGKAGDAPSRPGDPGSAGDPDAPGPDDSGPDDSGQGGPGPHNRGPDGPGGGSKAPRERR